jgi:hypothetical protein
MSVQPLRQLSAKCLPGECADYLHKLDIDMILIFNRYTLKIVAGRVAFMDIADYCTSKRIYYNDDELTTIDNELADLYPNIGLRRVCGSINYVISHNLQKVTIYKKQRLHISIDYKIIDGKMVAHGDYIKYYPNMMNDILGKFKDGELSGKWIKFHELGGHLKYLEYIFVNGIHHGVQFVYDAKIRKSYCFTIFDDVAHTNYPEIRFRFLPKIFHSFELEGIVDAQEPDLTPVEIW